MDGTGLNQLKEEIRGDETAVSSAANAHIRFSNYSMNITALCFPSQIKLNVCLPFGAAFPGRQRAKALEIVSEHDSAPVGPCAACFRLAATEFN